jgi:hypothetical protein
MGGLHVDFRLRAHHGETWATADGPCEVGVEQTQGVSKMKHAQASMPGIDTFV